jgi:His/Glu/Gln/Arg/opine family amino acid ABC transporter permease subunit
MSLDFGSILQYWPFLLSALGVTLLLSAASILCGLAIGLVLGTWRAYGGPVARAVLAFYIDSVRSIPILVVIIWTYFALPLLVGLSLQPMAAGIVALAFHLGAYAAEVVRAGLLSVRGGQLRAGLALGMSRPQAIRFIVLPQALIRMMPPFGSLIVIAVKDSAIASVIAVPELMHQSQLLAGITYRPFEIFTVAMVLYFVVLYPIARGTDRLYRKLAHLGAS